MKATAILLNYEQYHESKAKTVTMKQPQENPRPNNDQAICLNKDGILQIVGNFSEEEGKAKEQRRADLNSTVHSSNNTTMNARHDH